MNEVEKKVKVGLWRQRIGYGSSDFACNLIWQMISLYLLYFYTNVMHLNAGAVSVMFLVTKVIDGISDLIVGFLIDKTNTRWGKSRPWILFGAVPFGVAAVLDIPYRILDRQECWYMRMFPTFCFPLHTLL